MKKYMYIILIGCVGIIFSQDPPDPPDAVTKVASSVKINTQFSKFNKLIIDS